MEDHDQKASQRIAGLSPEKQALLALRLKEKRAQEAKVHQIPVREDLSSYPLSFAQKRMWFFYQWEPESPFYNIVSMVRLEGDLDIAALHQSFNEIVRRHEVLRARFVTDRGQPVQIIEPDIQVPLPIVDLTDLTEELRDERLTELARYEGGLAFDLTKGNLIRSSLVKLGSHDHVLFLTFHHIVSDGWSIGVFIQEAALLYEAYVAGKPVSLPALPIQYADFADWQQKWLQGEVIEKQLAYWRARLGNAEVVLDLPTDRPRPAVQTFNGAIEKFVLPPELVSGLKSLAQRQEATLFMTLLAVFQALLHRYSGLDEVRVGTPIANRNRREVENLIGLFVNTLVMQADFSADPTFTQLLNQVREMALGAYAHQDLPLETILDELKLDRDLSRTPLFQVMFTLQESPLKSLHLEKTKFSVMEPQVTTAKFDLTLFMEESDAGLVGAFEYNTDLFDASTIAQMGEHFTNLVRCILADPNEKVSALALLSQTERKTILFDWNDTLTDYPAERSLVDLFNESSARYADTPAMIAPMEDGGEEIITYRDLDAQANQLAHYLQHLGIGPDVLVGIFMERSMDMVIATLAIIKAGGAYLPLDLGYPPERLAFMLDDGQVPVLITKSQYKDNLPQVGTGELEDQKDLPYKLICMDLPQDMAEVRTQPDSIPHCSATAEDLAYVMYTSGSTGKPKGVAIPQRAIIRLIFNTNYIDLKPGLRIAHASNPSFDAATLEIWGALLFGGCLVIVPRDTALSARAYAAYLREKCINILFVTTALFNYLAREDPQAFASVDQVMFGGEAVDVNSVRMVLKNGSPKRLVHVYGPTESTTFASWLLVEAVADQDATVPIGRPISNTTLYVLDKRRQPVPVGVSGELYIGGDGLATGYFKRPELTSERFITNPFIQEYGGKFAQHFKDHRLYKTGDLVRFRPDGSIEFIGRIDNQVKLRGLRIELGEIESVIGQYPSVQNNIVILREDSPGDKRLVAYLVPVPNNKIPPVDGNEADQAEQVQIDISDLRRFMKEKLADFMIPAAFVILEKMPINANGKIERKALPVPDQSRPDLGHGYAAPSNPVEKYLVSRWEDVLGIDRIGIHDNFFELGGDSLKAAVLMNRLQEELGDTAHVRALFMAPTVAELSGYLFEYYPHTIEKVERDYAGVTVIRQEEEADGKKPAVGQGADIEPEQSSVDETKLRTIRQIIQPLSSRPSGLPLLDPPKNPPAVFVLSPPRSGSTLLRTMLAGHPNLFSPPELDLLSFNTLAERQSTFSGKYSFWLEGVERAIMELRHCDADTARQMMLEFENQGMSTQQFYRTLQDWISQSAADGNRMLVDKTPVYALDLEILKRAELDFDQPYYIHLMRHPFASIHSFIEAKLDGVFFRYDHPFTQRELAEMVWIISHQNILEFLSDIPAQRQMRISFEELVSQPPAVMEQICEFLRIDFHAEMLKPYDGDRMTSGVRPGAQMVGDFKFYLRKDIDPKAADRWKKFHSEDNPAGLSQFGWDVANSLGYPVPVTKVHPRSVESANRIQRVPRDGDLPLSFAQQRLWFLDQWEPGSPYYNVPAAVRINGRLNPAAMTETFNTIISRHEVLRTRFPVVDGRPVQTIEAEVRIEPCFYNLQHLPESEREKEARILAMEEARLPFDLATGPLFRACVIRLAKEDFIVVLTLHHIVSDGWSNKVLINEIAAIYQAYLDQHSSPLPDLPIQYADFASWQRQVLQGKLLEKQLDYWKDKLKDAPALLELPTDRPRPAVQTLRGERYIFELPGTLLNALRNLSKQEGTTLFMTLLTAFKILLYRYSGQEDILVGTPVANRNRAEIEGLIGFFVNTLVLRSNISSDQSFRQLLAGVKRTALEAYEHQDLPFETLVDELRLERNQSHTPLFQVMFTLQELTGRSLTFPGLTITPLDLDTGTSKFDIILTMGQRGDLFKGGLEYNTDLFDASTIQRMAEHYQMLLNSIIANPDQKILDLPILTDAERRKLLVEWNHTFDPGTHNYLDQTIDHLFERQVERTPEATAVIYQGEQMTFGELNQRANQLARYLIKLGVGSDVIVGLCVERSLDMIVGIMGILKAGGAYLPLDPDYPRDRLSYILTDAKAPIMLSQQEIVSDLFGTDVTEKYAGSLSGPGEILDWKIVCLDQDWPDIALEDNSNLSGSSFENAKRSSHSKISNSGNGRDASEMSSVRERSSRDLAYVIYTSGSTGLPKGVMIEHHSAINLWLGLSQEIYARHAEEGRPLRVSLNAPLPFDASVQEWIMLLSGHALVIIPADIRQDGDALLHYIEQQQIDVLDCVPSQLKLLIAAGMLDNKKANRVDERANELKSWRPRAVLPGGEAIDRLTWAELVKASESLGMEFYNMYGPTECTVDSTIGRASASPYQPTIGRPVVNAQMYVLDANFQPTPLGVPGELYIGGEGVGRGYLARAELTEEKFILNPLISELKQAGLPLGDKDRIYRTGDRVRYLQDGKLDYLSRVDLQVKVRGYRIELGEIENVLKQAPGVAEAVVIVREDEPGNKQLVGYLVAAKDELAEAYDQAGFADAEPISEIVEETAETLSVSKLRAFLRTKLPDYMIPAVYVILESLPLTPNRKIDRKALPRPEGLRLDLGSDYQAPRTAEEQILADIWASLLKLERVGIHDNFFELGGDSILSIQVVARANQSGLHLKPRYLFEAQTIAELAALISSAPSGSSEMAEQGIVSGPVILTPVQRWFFEQEFSNLHHWNQALLLEVHMPVQIAILREAVQFLLGHHDALRMRFKRQNGASSNGDEVYAWTAENAVMDGSQLLTSGVEETVQRVDLSGLEPSLQKQRIEVIAAEFQEKLDPVEGPLMRVVYFDLGHDRPGRLLIIIHHLVIDGVSWRILMEDLQTLYYQLGQGIPPELPAKTTSFKQWAEILSAFVEDWDRKPDKAQKEELSFWLNEMQAIQSSQSSKLPLDIMGAENLEGSIGSVRIGLDYANTQALLKDVPSAYHTEINDALLAALTSTLTAWTGKSEVVVTLEGHGRQDLGLPVDLSRTVGWFTTLFPARLRLDYKHHNTSKGQHTGEVLVSIKEQLRQIPNKGMGFGLLRHMSKAGFELRECPLGEVSFNYLGQVDQSLPDGSPFGPASESSGPAHHPDAKRSHLIDVIASVIDGQLRMEWLYCQEMYRRETIEKLARQYVEELKTIIEHCTSPEVGGYTPSDFPDVELSQEDIEDILEELAEDGE
jgi:amino acid adenylation domain-containing protein/non-ribosomal peptide synthase protein (TIGR01720 family)